VAGSSPHGDYALNGLAVWFVLALIVLALAGAAYIVLDAPRRPATAFRRVPRMAWLVIAFAYVAVAALGVAGWLFGFAEVLGARFGTGFGALTLAVLPIEVAYLLRVAFPRPAE